MTIQEQPASIGDNSIDLTNVGLSSNNSASFIHYLVASLVFVIYADQVCPLLEVLSPIQLVMPMLLVYPLRSILARKLQRLSYERRITAQFKLDVLMFLTAGFVLVAVNLFFYDAPWHSNVKAVVGLSMLGMFVAIDLALIGERQLMTELVQNGHQLELGRRGASFSQKFSTMAIIIIVSISLVIFLVVNKDLDWLLTTGINLGPEQARNSILLEVALVMLVFITYSVRIVLSYTKNLMMYLGKETKVLYAVSQGDLTLRVPVATQDEFGVMARDTNSMISSLQCYQNELKQTRDVSILALASLAETRDNETGAHLLRTQSYVKALAQELRSHPDFSDQLDNETIELLYKSAPLHDVGKVGIPDSILLKPAKLTDQEFVIMKTHAQLGADALLVAESHMGSNSFLGFAREISLSHHEKWDGSGYPAGSKGDDIPLSGRLMALADVYDALLSKRVYKPAFPHDKAKAIIIEGRGSHFDPRVVDAFLACEAEFLAIAEAFKD